jgi:hypothetical protein
MALIPITLLSAAQLRAGAEQIRYDGMLKGRPLPIGTYRALLVAADPGGWSRPASASFSVAAARPAGGHPKTHPKTHPKAHPKTHPKTHPKARAKAHPKAHPKAHSNAHASARSHA